MNRVKKLIIVSGLVVHVSALYAALDLFDPLSWVRTKIDPASVGMYVTVGEDKSQLLERLKEEKSALDGLYKESDEAHRAQLEKINQQTVAIKDRIGSSGGSEFSQRCLSLLNEQHQTIIDTQLSQKQTSALVDQHIKVLDEYMKDASFSEASPEVRTIYSFEELHSASEKIATLDDAIARFEEQKNNSSADLENYRKYADSIVRQLKEREREYKEAGFMGYEGSLTSKQRNELLSLHVQLLTYKKRFYEQKIQEIKRMMSLVETKMFVSRAQRKVIEDQRLHIKEGLRVDEADVSTQKAELEKKKHTYLETKESYYRERKNLSSERDRLVSRFETWAKKLNLAIHDINSLDDMVIEPSDPSGYESLGALFNVKEHILVLDKRIEQIDVLIQAEEAKFTRDQITVDIVESWHKITSRRFRSEADLDIQVQSYQDRLRQIEREIVTISDKRTNATSFINQKNKVLDGIKARVRKLDERAHLFKDSMMEYLKTKEHLKSAFHLSNEQLDIGSKIIETHTTVISILQSASKQIHTIIAELTTTGPRSAHVLSFEGIKNIGNDVVALRTEIGRLASNYFKQFAPSAVGKKFHLISLSAIGNWLLKLFIIFLFYFVIKLLVAVLAVRLLEVSPDLARLYNASRLLACAFLFIRRHFNSLFLWMVFYGLLRFEVVQDIFPQIVFYLISIPFFMYLGQRAIAHLVMFNTDQEHLFFSEAAYDRFRIIIPILLHTTILVFLFREAYLLASYSRSELPTILLALYSVIVRVVLITLIRREDILELIPEHGSVWEWIRTQVEHHYHLVFGLLVMLIVMSEPHLAYGKYISYLLWGVLGSAFLFRVLMLVHLFVKRVSSVAFFSVEGGQIRDRFVYAKSAYGLFVIVTFVVCALFTIIAAAQFWGYTISFHDLGEWLHHPLFTLNENTVDHREISTIVLLQIFAFVVSSFVIASLFNHFALRPVFDLIMVDAGVQHTVSIITHYLIVVVVMLIGFQRVGLGYVILLLVAPLLLGIGWSLRDYANDFVSYFIIVVQRPFNIGDFIRIEDQMGTVRKITPRSVAIRTKNNATLLIPNSKVINGQITNWNYARSFITFPDVMLAVGYTADPAEVKTIIVRVLDAHMHVLKTPRPIIRLEDFGEHGYVFLVRGYVSIDNIAYQYDIASDVRFNIVRALKDRGIDIVAYTQHYKTIQD